MWSFLSWRLAADEALEELRQIARHVVERLAQVIPVAAAEETDGRDAPVGDDHDGAPVRRLHEAHVGLRARPPGAEDSGEVASGLRAPSEPGDVAFEPQHLLARGGGECRLGEIHDAREEPALTEAPHDLRLKVRGHFGAEPAVALIVHL